MAKNKTREFECDFCDKSFVKESSFAAHSCAKKMRWLDKDNKNSVLGYITYKRFFQLTGMSRRELTFKTFIESKLYSDFLKFGMWINDASIVDAQAYTDYLIKGSFKLRDWTKSSIYEGYLREYLFKERPMDGLERTIVWINSWCEENETAIENFFNGVSTFKIVDVLRNGKISPWLFFVCDNSYILLDRLDASQWQLLGGLLDGKVWTMKIKKHKKEVEECKAMMRSLGI